MTTAPTYSNRLVAGVFDLYVSGSDLLPPRIRYGYVHPLSRLAWAGPLASVDATACARTSRRDAAVLPNPDADVVATLVTDSLDGGGIGAVVEMLALGMGRSGVRPIVVCPQPGARVARLRNHGVTVVTAVDEVTDALAAADVIQLHSAPPELEAAAMHSGKPIVTVMHNTEIHYTRRRWRTFAKVMSASAIGIAVSETVRGFHARRLPLELSDRLRVIPNAAADPAPSSGMRARARAALERVLGEPLGRDVVFVCLARYDSQKNIAGLVCSFTSAAEEMPGIRLVCAGDPSDWAEYRRADALRRCSPAGDRVHLLGNSDATTVLAAADAFILNSFFEGWPVAATEAAAMGLPLLLSDVGGASELVLRDPMRSVLVPNPSGEAAAVSDRRVARARRSARDQRNKAEIATGVRHIATQLGATPPPARIAGAARMADEHASVLRAVAATRSTPRPQPAQRRRRSE